MLTSFGAQLNSAFNDVGVGIIHVLPKILVALIVFIIGWVIGVVLERVIEQIFKALRVDKALEAAGVGDLVSRSGFSLNSGRFIGALVKWFIIVVFLIASFNILGLNDVTQFLTLVVVAYLPRVIVASLVLIIAGVLAEVVQKTVSGSARAAGVKSPGFFGGVARWAVWVFAILIALQQLNVVGPLADTIFTGLIAMIALAGGLAFGLGGRDAAARYIEKLRGDISSHGH
ncbi:MAG: mechanosensitive ion channel family protein [Minisyncoccota bacterium]